jgi:hypothetical protein
MARDVSKRRSSTTASDEPDYTPLIQALADATQSLTNATNQLTRFTQLIAGVASGGPQGIAVGPGGAETAQINTWEDDPFSEATPTSNPPIATPIAVGVPVNSNPNLQITIVEPRPVPALYNPGTPEFRYWTAAEALARAVNFWTPLLPAGTTWSTSNPMRVALVAGEWLNASYHRAVGLRFYHLTVKGREIFSGESPDVTCHELGHAILDALKPQLFDAASTEADAFHEAFGDMTAILSALQFPSMREKVLAETAGRLNANSRLSRVGEHLGWGIRNNSSADSVDEDCLRNAANTFAYRRPDTLPSNAPATLLSSEEHSFSRVFTARFWTRLRGC